MSNFLVNWLGSKNNFGDFNWKKGRLQKLCVCVFVCVSEKQMKLIKHNTNILLEKWPNLLKKEKLKLLRPLLLFTSLNAITQSILEGRKEVVRLTLSSSDREQKKTTSNRGQLKWVSLKWLEKSSITTWRISKTPSI